VLIPWADVEQIIQYSSEPGEQDPVQRIGFQRRIGAMEARKVTGWRLDRGRLATVAATVAPDIRIVGASVEPGPALKDPARQQVPSGSDPWLIGLTVVWLLWRPDSNAFFTPQGFT
jgi:hypothetical protein